MDKRFLMILGAIIVIFGGIIAIDTHKNNKVTSNANPSNHVMGEGKSGVTLTEYGDFECPYCEQYYPTVKQVVSDYNSQIFFQFRNLPLTSIHQNAFAAARAAEAASVQGKFWEMHDALYANQNDWVQSSNPQSVFNSFAQQLNLNVTQFKADYASSKVNATINADIEAFDKTKEVMETPTFFLDGKKVSPDNSAASFKALLGAEIAKKTAAKS